MTVRSTLVLADVSAGKIILNPADCDEMDLEMGDILEIVDEDVDEAGAARVQVSDEVEKGTFRIAENLADSIGAVAGHEYLLRKYEKELTNTLDRVLVGVTSDGSIQDVDIEAVITDQLEDVEQFLMHRLIFNGLRIHWKEKGLILEISETEPRLSDGEYVVFQELKLEMYPVMKSAFNGILLIDMSKSMQAKDMPVDSSVKNAFQQLHDMAYGKIQEIEDYLKEVESDDEAKRIDSAVISAMLFFSEKIARGKGEKIAVVPYSDDALPLMFQAAEQSTKWLDVSTTGYADMKMDVAMVLGSSILSMLGSVEARHTNMGKALTIAHEIAEEMAAYEVHDEGLSRPNPVMIILLTDGEFDVGPSPVRFAKKHLRKRSRTVVHTVGIGSEIDESILRRISELGHGEFTRANDLGRLMEFYSSLAQKFKTVIKVGKGEDEASISQSKAYTSSKTPQPAPPAPAKSQPEIMPDEPQTDEAAPEPVAVAASEEPAVQPEPAQTQPVPGMSDEELPSASETAASISDKLKTLDQGMFFQEINAVLAILDDPNRLEDADKQTNELIQTAEGIARLDQEMKDIRQRYLAA